ncbi:MAG: multicopper oxidase domain-containing protein [Gemmatimonadota bacterium]|nr:multicopper oxidase domain-containing protein [Gemmatimonadota bacterium]
MRYIKPTTAFVAVTLALSGCDYVRLLRPSVLKQLNPHVVRLVNELPAVDDPNEAIVARLFAHGGLSHADLGPDGIFRDQVRIPKHEYIWKPAIIVMRHGGELEVDFANEDEAFHIAFMPSNDNRRVVELPVKQRGTVRVRLDAPGLYWFGCPVANHAGRGMLGLVLVKGEVPAEAKLDRPRMPRP